MYLRAAVGGKLAIKSRKLYVFSILAWHRKKTSRFKGRVQTEGEVWQGEGKLGQRTRRDREKRTTIAIRCSWTRKLGGDGNEQLLRSIPLLWECLETVN